MNGDTFILFVITFFFVPFLHADSQYECGAHGKFEYCIDGIPGCVIGCHCHPGYYFDTDTKICEPNIKLTQDFRRQYLSDPPRIHVAPITSPPEERRVTLNAVDEKIDEIAKDADDLGDWLYNQFFKTIENQVINKTQGEELPPTRRSGDVLLNKPARRSHKHWKGKKKKKSKGLKSKLLRITEDDSLFDSDSGSSQEYDTSSSSESDTSNSEEFPDKGEKKHIDHGHKKILIFNKKPQPPLPSFIFLPNMDTPYYPPIGLPPPPAMPMYPMVPVPPMLPGPQIGGPLFPYPGVPPRCEEDEVTTDSTPITSPMEVTSITIKESTNEITTETTTTTSTTTTTTDKDIATDTDTDIATDTDTATDTATTTVEVESLRIKHKKKNKPIGRTNNKKEVPLLRGNRNKQLFKKLREKLNRKNKLENYFADQYQEPDGLLDENGPSEFIPNRESVRTEMYERPPPDVDFKYLAELIHKADLNKSLNSRLNQSKQNNNIPVNIPILKPSRRFDYPMNIINNRPGNNAKRQISRMGNPNDSFYTNLGKQIASMIRNIDSKQEHEVNIEIEGPHSRPPSHQPSQTSPIFNENNYASRSYWERSVRSPLKYIGSFKMDHLKKSNEELYSLENKVEIAASTAPSLSLHELENIINTVEKVQSRKPKRNNKYPEKIDHSNTSFKYNLLPGNVETIQPILQPKPVQSLRKDSDNIRKLNARRNSPDADSFLLSNFRQLSPDYGNPITNTGYVKDSIQSARPTRKPNANNKLIEFPLPTRLNTNITPTVMKPTANKTNFKYQQSPVLMNHRSLNYHPYNNNNQYQFQKALTPNQYTGLTKSLIPYGKFEKPSYFHHEFHHFDYFDK